MAYSNVSDVQKLFTNAAFDSSSPVTSGDIQTVHIPQADAFIDARLRGFYQVPIVKAEDLGLMRLISANLAAGFAAEILYETSQQPNDQASARRRRDYAEGMLDRIAEGRLTLDTPRRPTAGIANPAESSAKGAP